MRGVAAFGVICIHSGLAVHNQTDSAAAALRASFSFAVPFFLALSFFFAIRAETVRPLSWNPWLRRHSERLLIPFFFWSLVYLGLHVAKLILHHQTQEIKSLLLNDPAGLLLSGGTSVALYFVPLLLSGLILLRILAPLLNRLPLPGLLLGFMVGAILHQLVPDRFPEASLQGPWLALPKFCLSLLAEAVRCFPLIFMAAILNRFLFSPSTKEAPAFLALGGVILILQNLFPLTFGLTESIWGLGAFLLAWGLSGVVKANPTAFIVGRFSFGVYLVHQVFLELIQVTFPYGGTIGIGGTLLISTVTFAASMATVAVASRSGPFVSRVFGLK